MRDIYDVIIIGAGPAGMTAGIYASRAGLSALVIEGNFIQGGQIVNTYEVDNYPGLPGINGLDLADKMKEHLSAHHVPIKRAKVESISLEDNIKVLHTKKEDFYARTVVLAAGAVHRKLEVPGEKELTGMGVSYCATCDGAFFKDKVTAVVGGGDAALEDALLLARTCKKVYLIHRRDQFRAVQCLQDSVKKDENIEILWNTVVTEIGGEGKTGWIQTENRVTGVSEKINLDGVFVAAGLIPDTGFVKGVVELDPNGYIKAGEDCRTNVPGIFAAGDNRTKQLRQIVTAVADGANCITSAEEYLRSIAE